MKRPILLDLFCGAGGASMGYYRAGFHVVGVDIVRQPNYPFDFATGDALDYLERCLNRGLTINGHRVAAIHLSPPCQRWSTATRDPERHPDLITDGRILALDSQLPFIIENVPAAPLRSPVKLCGSHFGMSVRRHRMFESNVRLTSPGACDHKSQGTPVGVYGDHPDRKQHLRPDGTARGTKATSLEEAQWAMGIDWMSWKELAESIPPAYTEYLGRQLMGVL